MSTHLALLLLKRLVNRLFHGTSLLQDAGGRALHRLLQIGERHRNVFPPLSGYRAWADVDRGTTKHS